jgi:hypothetical protein
MTHVILLNLPKQPKKTNNKKTNNNTHTFPKKIEQKILIAKKNKKERDFLV